MDEDWVRVAQPVALFRYDRTRSENTVHRVYQCSSADDWQTHGAFTREGALPKPSVQGHFERQASQLMEQYVGVFGALLQRFFGGTFRKRCDVLVELP